VKLEEEQKRPRDGISNGCEGWTATMVQGVEELFIASAQTLQKERETLAKA
jgi:hypothetical protein